MWSFVFNRSSTDYTVTITPGSYSITSLLTSLQTSMNSLDSNSYVLSYNSNTFTVTISGSAAFQLKFAGSTSPWRELGFTQANTGTATSHTGSNAISLERPINIYLTINELGLTGISSSNKYFTFHFLNSSPSSELYRYDENNNYKQKITRKSTILSNLNVYIDTDIDNLNLQNSSWVLVLRLNKN